MQRGTFSCENNRTKNFLTPCPASSDHSKRGSSPEPWASEDPILALSPAQGRNLGGRGVCPVGTHAPPLQMMPQVPQILGFLVKCLNPLPKPSSHPISLVRTAQPAGAVGWGLGGDVWALCPEAPYSAGKHRMRTAAGRCWYGTPRLGLIPGH